MLYLVLMCLKWFWLLSALNSRGLVSLGKGRRPGDILGPHSLRASPWVTIPAIVCIQFFHLRLAACFNLGGELGRTGGCLICPVPRSSQEAEDLEYLSSLDVLVCPRGI